MDDEIIREIQINRSVKSSELKEYALKNPGSNLDWFLKGNIDQLRDNLGKVTTQTDIASIETRIAILEKVSSKQMSKKITVIIYQNIFRKVNARRKKSKGK